MVHSDQAVVANVLGSQEFEDFWHEICPSVKKWRSIAI
jgi:hypothetical protein